MLETDKPWNEIHRSQALDVLGVPKDIRDARMKIDARAGESLIDVQRNVATSEIDRLKTLKDDLLIDDNEQERDEAMMGLAPLDHPTRLIKRYEAASKKAFATAVRWLDHSRRRAGRSVPRIDIKTAVEAADLRSYMLVKDHFENVSEEFRSDPSFLEQMSIINEEAVTFGLPPIKLTPTAHTSPPVTAAGASMVRAVREEARDAKPIDEAARRAKRPDPAKFRAELNKQAAKSQKKR